MWRAFVKFHNEVFTDGILKSRVSVKNKRSAVYFDKGRFFSFVIYGIGFIKMSHLHQNNCIRPIFFLICLLFL